MGSQVAPSFDITGEAQSRINMVPVAALEAQLAQLEKLLQRLSPDDYTRRPVGGLDSSIGGHVRHCLDHVRALLDGVDSGTIDYDDRQRGTEVECDVSAAAAAIRSYRDRLCDAGSIRRLARSVEVRAMASADTPTLQVTSSVAREFVFVISHTIHHAALLSVMMRELGIDLPDDYGYAPSTLAYQRGAACAPPPS